MTEFESITNGDDVTQQIEEIIRNEIKGNSGYAFFQNKGDDDIFIRSFENTVKRVFNELAPCIIGKFPAASFHIKDIRDSCIVNYFEAAHLDRALRDLVKKEAGLENASDYEELDTVPKSDEEILSSVLCLAAFDTFENEDCTARVKNESEYLPFARYLFGILDKTAASLVKWDKKTESELFRELKINRPEWINTESWHILCLDMLEWFTMKYKLDFIHLKEFYDVSAKLQHQIIQRIAAYAFRYQNSEGEWFSTRFCKVNNELCRISTITAESLHSVIHKSELRCLAALHLTLASVDESPLAAIANTLEKENFGFVKEWGIAYDFLKRIFNALGAEEVSDEFVMNMAKNCTWITRSHIRKGSRYWRNKQNRTGMPPELSEDLTLFLLKSGIDGEMFNQCFDSISKTMESVSPHQVMNNLCQVSDSLKNSVSTILDEEKAVDITEFLLNNLQKNVIQISEEEKDNFSTLVHYAEYRSELNEGFKPAANKKYDEILTRFITHTSILDKNSAIHSIEEKYRAICKVLNDTGDAKEEDIGWTFLAHNVLFDEMGSIVNELDYSLHERTIEYIAHLLYREVCKEHNLTPCIRGEF